MRKATGRCSPAVLLLSVEACFDREVKFLSRQMTAKTLAGLPKAERF